MFSETLSKNEIRQRNTRRRQGERRDCGKKQSVYKNVTPDSLSQPNQNTTVVIIIYHDFLPPPRRGIYVKSDNTHTIVNIHPLAHILDICALILSSSYTLSGRIPRWLSHMLRLHVRVPLRLH